MKWTSDLSVGVDLIDEQHRELFERIGKLVDAIKSSTCKYTIGGTLDFLEEYVIAHFRDEETLMREHGYPGYPGHKAQHEHFRREFHALRDELKGEESNYNRSALTNQIVVDWILDHIKKRDVELGAYLRGRGVSRP